jgi:hypothetical protein
MQRPEVKKGTIVLRIPERDDISDNDFLFYHLGVVTGVWRHPGECARCGVVSFSSTFNCDTSAVIPLMELPEGKNSLRFCDTFKENKNEILIAAFRALCRMEKRRIALERVEARLLIEDALER